MIEPPNSVEIVRLADPIGELREIRLRQPVLGDVIDIGAARRVIVDDLSRTSTETAGRHVVDSSRVARWAARLSCLPETTVRALSLRDAVELQAAVLRLVVPFEVAAMAVE